MDLTAEGPVSSAVRALSVGFNGFGLDLHRGLPSGGNTFISPLSIGAALAALIPGARGQTAAELVRVLRLQGTAEDTVRAMAELRRILEPRGTEEETWNDETKAFETVVRETFRLSLATGLLVEEAYPLHTAFCDALTEAFGAEFLSVTFANPQETATASTPGSRKRPRAASPTSFSRSRCDPTCGSSWPTRCISKHAGRTSLRKG